MKIGDTARMKVSLPYAMGSRRLEAGTIGTIVSIDDYGVEFKFGDGYFETVGIWTNQVEIVCNCESSHCSEHQPGNCKQDATDGGTMQYVGAVCRLCVENAQASGGAVYIVEWPVERS